MTLGEEIAQNRAEKFMSQRQLASKAGLTNSTISRIELDAVNPDLKTIGKIAEALDVDMLKMLSECGFLAASKELLEYNELLLKLDDQLKNDLSKEISNLFVKYARLNEEHI